MLCNERRLHQVSFHRFVHVVSARLCTAVNVCALVRYVVSLAQIMMLVVLLVFVHVNCSERDVVVEYSSAKPLQVSIHAVTLSV